MGVHCFGVVTQPLNAVGHLDERAEAGEAHHLAVDDVTDAMLSKKLTQMSVCSCLRPNDRRRCLRLNGQDQGLDLVALLQHFRRVLHLAPAQVADVNEAIDPVFDFDESAELGEVAHLALVISCRSGSSGCRLSHGLHSSCFRPGLKCDARRD